LTSKNKPETLYALSQSSRCYGCDRALEENDIVKLTKKKDEKEVYCLDCSGLASEYCVLKKGDAALTRRAKKHSKSHFVIVKWSAIWKSYERQGLLIEKEALRKAQEEA
tara:strand:+ start:78 stop:404 length:327 start_codon:yes stop_codon:yes gene_type:complete